MRLRETENLSGSDTGAPPDLLRRNVFVDTIILPDSVAVRMSDQPEGPPSHALRKVWHSPLPDGFYDLVAFAPSGERIAAGTWGSVNGNSAGSLETAY